MLPIAVPQLDSSIGLVVAFVLTLMVFSYIFGDNPLYRLAQHVLVGVVAGYAIVVAYHSVLRPRLVEPLATDPTGNALLIIPILLSILLIMKSRRSLSWWGNTAMAYLFGVGAALAVGGALIGSLATQVQASWNVLQLGDYPMSDALNIVSAIIITLGATGVLMYFYYYAPAEGAPRRPLTALRLAWGRVGRWFILVALGAIFANLMVARLSLLIGRIRFLLDTLTAWIG
jgi:hypothetical protein